MEDPTEVINDRNKRDCTIKITLGDVPQDLHREKEIVPDYMLITLLKTGRHISISYFAASQEIKPSSRLGWSGETLVWEGKLINLLPYREAFKMMSQTMYIGSFRNAINVGQETEYFDIQIGQSFIKQWSEYKTGGSKEQKEAAIRLQEDIKRIFKYSGLEINPSDDGKTLQLIVNNRPYRLSELGSGLAQFIIVFANVMVKQPKVILIDEPELNLHPALQMDFLLALGKQARGLIFATHSIGLARSVADQIYSIHMDGNGASHVKNYNETPNLAEILGELSYSGYRELGFDKLILVEGPSEMKTFGQFLRKVREDHKIMLLPLCGNSLIKKDSELELSEIKSRVCSNTFAIIDSERTQEGEELKADRKQFEETCKKVGIPCTILDLRSTENYFPDRAIKKALGEKCRALGPYEKLNELNHGWSKSDNWRIAMEMTPEEIDSSGFGAIFKGIINSPVAT